MCECFYWKIGWLASYLEFTILTHFTFSFKVSKFQRLIQNFDILIREILTFLSIETLTIVFKNCRRGDVDVHN